MLLSLLVIIPASLITISLLYWSIRLGIGPMPSAPKVLAAVQQLLPEHLDGDIIELGCGWGHLIERLQQHYPHHLITGYEQSPVPYFYTSARYPAARIYRMDFFQANYQQAGLVVCYLFPDAMKRFQNEILPHLPNGCWILSHTFSLPGLLPIHVINANDFYQTPIYLYQNNI